MHTQDEVESVVKEFMAQFGFKFAADRQRLEATSTSAIWRILEQDAIDDEYEDDLFEEWLVSHS